MYVPYLPTGMRRTGFLTYFERLRNTDSDFSRMEQTPQVERRYNLSEIIAILKNTPVSGPEHDSPSPSSHSSTSSSSDTSSSPPAPTCVRLKRRYCTWCGRAGHAKDGCTDLTTAFKMGVIRARRGKICLINGGKIPWPHGEKCLKDWVLRHGRSGNLEEYRRLR